MSKNESKNMKKRELDEDMIVIFHKEKCTLRHAIEKCRPGETIEGVPIHDFDMLLERFQTNRNKRFRYSVDRRYGDWRFILFDVKKK